MELAEKLLLTAADLPPTEITAYFTACLVALAVLLASGHDKCQG